MNRLDLGLSIQLLILPPLSFFSPKPVSF